MRPLDFPEPRLRATGIAPGLSAICSAVERARVCLVDILSDLGDTLLPRCCQAVSFVIQRIGLSESLVQGLGMIRGNEAIICPGCTPGTPTCQVWYVRLAAGSRRITRAVRASAAHRDRPPVRSVRPPLQRRNGPQVAVLPPPPCCRWHGG